MSMTGLAEELFTIDCWEKERMSPQEFRKYLEGCRDAADNLYRQIVELYPDIGRAILEYKTTAEEKLREVPETETISEPGH